MARPKNTSRMRRDPGVIASTVPVSKEQGKRFDELRLQYESELGMLLSRSQVLDILMRYPPTLKVTPTH